MGGGVEKAISNMKIVVVGAFMLVLATLFLILSPSRLLAPDFSLLVLVPSVFSPSAWNDHPLLLQQKPYLDSFKSNLKTFLFPKL